MTCRAVIDPARPVRVVTDDRHYVNAALREGDPVIARGHALTAGLMAGRRGAAASDNPFDDDVLAERWASGWRIAEKAAAERRERTLRAAGRCAAKADGRWDLEDGR